MKLTSYEVQILEAARDNEFADAFEGDSPWVFAVIDESGLSPQMARGVIASLVKKGIAEVDDWGDDDCVFYLTDFGLTLDI